MSLRYFPLDGTDFRLSIGLRALRDRSWLETDRRYAQDITKKKALLKSHRDEVFAETPESRPAQNETLDLIKRELETNHSDVALIAECKSEPSSLVRASLLVQEDLVLMHETNEGYILSAASVSFPTGWNLTEKVGKTMQAIHQPVPELNTEIGTPIDRFFKNLKLGKKVERFNWGLYDSDALFQPSWWRQERSVDPSITSANIGEKIFFRVERQTLQRLPSGYDILFTIRIFNNSLAEVCKSKARAERLLHALRTMGTDMREYKSLPRYEPLITAFLEKAAA